MTIALRQLHDLVAAQTTGVVRIVYRLTVTATATATGAPPRLLRLELVRGWVHAFVEAPAQSPSGSDPEAEIARLRAEVKRRAAAPPDEALAAHLVAGLAAPVSPAAVITTITDEARLRLGAVPPFHPARALRAAAAAWVVAIGEAVLDELLAHAPLALPGALHGSALDPDERALGAALAATAARGARTLDELLAAARCPAPRARALLRELLVLGAVVGPGGAFVLDGEAIVARRRDYHRAAREVHPDLFPDDDDATRAQRTREMAELAARRRRGE